MVPFLFSAVPGDVALWLGTGVAAVFIAQNALNVKLVMNLISMTASRNREAQLGLEKSVLLEENEDLKTKIKERDATIKVLRSDNDRLTIERDELRRGHARHDP